MLKLVATDLDGTLLHTDGTVTDRTRAALTAVEDLGVTVVFVTGRPIPVDVGLRVAGLMREAVPGTTFALEKTTGFGKEQTFMERYPLPADIEVGPLDAIFDDRTVKLLAQGA